MHCFHYQAVSSKTSVNSVIFYAQSESVFHSWKAGWNSEEPLVSKKISENFGVTDVGGQLSKDLPVDEKMTLEQMIVKLLWLNALSGLR